MQENNLDRARKSIRDLARADFEMLCAIAQDSWLDTISAIFIYLNELISLMQKRVMEGDGDE